MRNIGWFTWGSVFVCILSLALFVYTSLQRSNDVAEFEKLAEQTNHALCTLRSDLQRRYDAGTEFLENNPSGIPGLSAQEIARSLANQRSTLDALATLECP